MVDRNNAGRLGAGFISVCLETRWLGHFGPGTTLYWEGWVLLVWLHSSLWSSVVTLVCTVNLCAASSLYGEVLCFRKWSPRAYLESMPRLRVKSERTYLPNSGVRGRIVMSLSVHGQVGMHMISCVSSKQVPHAVR